MKDGVVRWRWRYSEDGVKEVCGVFDVWRDEGHKGFEVVIKVFGEVVGRTVATRDDSAALNIGFV